MFRESTDLVSLPAYKNDKNICQKYVDKESCQWYIDFDKYNCQNHIANHI